MHDAWRDTTIGAEITLQRGIDITRAEQNHGKIPVISSGGISSYHDTPAAKGPGVLIGRKGTLGTVFYVEGDYWPHDTTLWVKDFHGNDPRFVYHFFKNLNVMHLDVGTANPTLNRNHVHPILVKWPPLPEQKRIVSILGALDDMIELNRQMNETLEAMARALFKSWFVDFDPVRAKIEGRKPEGMDAETAALFPDSFEESALGLIPRGWNVLPVAQFIERISVGKRYEQKSVRPCGAVPVLDQGKSGIIGYHDDEPGTYASLDKPVAVFANHTCYMRLITHPFSAIQNVLPFVGDRVDTLWAYYATENRMQFSEYKGHWPDFIRQLSTVPTYKLTYTFSCLIRPLIGQTKSNNAQNNLLSVLRDTTLPRLLSGEMI